MAEKKLFSVTLSDGTKINDLELNGNNFKSATEITASMFAGKLSKVIIDGDAEAVSEGLIGEHNNMELVQIAHYTQAKHGIADGWYFVLREIPAAEIEKIRIEARLDYIEMMEDLA